MSDERASDGRFSESVSDDDLLFHFETGSRPFYGTSEIAAAFDLSTTHARRRLEALCAAGELQEVALSDRHTAWWRDRDVIALRSEADGYTAHDTSTGVASGGETRADALRALAEATDTHEERDLDPDRSADLEDGTDAGDGSPPF